MNQPILMMREVNHKSEDSTKVLNDAKAMFRSSSSGVKEGKCSIARFNCQSAQIEYGAENVRMDDEEVEKTFASDDVPAKHPTNLARSKTK